MDAERALADLAEVSPGIEAALVFEAGGPVIGAVGVSGGRKSLLAGAAQELVERASEARRGGGYVTQVHASLGERDIFVVRGANGERGIVAIASGRSASGLVFYDVKRCLASLARGDQDPEPAAGGTDDAA